MEAWDYIIKHNNKLASADDYPYINKYGKLRVTLKLGLLSQDSMSTVINFSVVS